MINQYLTITTRDYPPKSVIGKNVKKENDINKTNRVEYKAPITEPYKTYLCLDPCDIKNSEEVDSYMTRVIGIYPGLEYFTKGKLVNKETIKRDKLFNKYTMYQTQFCNIEKEAAEKEYEKKNAVKLPPDIYIPLTTNKLSHRHPITLNSKAYVRVEPIWPKNNLDPDQKMQEILKVTTGLTEYSEIISKTGALIMDEELHGHMPKQKFK